MLCLAQIGEEAWVQEPQTEKFGKSHSFLAVFTPHGLQSMPVKLKFDMKA